jgi:hypothetical protein
MKLNTIPLLSRVLVAAAALQGVAHAASPWVILDFSTPWTLGATPLGGVGTTWTKTGVDLRPGVPDVTATFTITGIGGGATLALDSGFDHHPGYIRGTSTASTSPYITYSLKLTDTVTGNPTTVPYVRLAGFDIDSEPGTNLTDVWGWSVSTAPDMPNPHLPPGTKLEQTTFGPGGYQTYWVQDGLRGENLPFNSDLAELPDEQIPYTVFADYSNFGGGDYIWGFTGSNGTEFLRAQDLIGIHVPEPGSAMAGLVTMLGMGSVVMRRRRR